MVLQHAILACLELVSSTFISLFFTIFHMHSAAYAMETKISILLHNKNLMPGKSLLRFQFWIKSFYVNGFLNSSYLLLNI